MSKLSACGINAWRDVIENAANTRMMAIVTKFFR
jgi:hypothetical protein